MMTGRNTKLTASVETYFDDLRRVRASGGSTGERSSYGPLANLLNAVGATLKPKMFCVGELADQGAGHPDFGLYTAKQVQKGRPREGQIPERGVVVATGKQRPGVRLRAGTCPQHPGGEDAVEQGLHQGRVEEARAPSRHQSARRALLRVPTGPP